MGLPFDQPSLLRPLLVGQLRAVLWCLTRRSSALGLLALGTGAPQAQPLRTRVNFCASTAVS